MHAQLCTIMTIYINQYQVVTEQQFSLQFPTRGMGIN